MGSRPSPPTVVMPTPTAPTLYQSVTPFEDYQALAEQLNRIQTETAKIQGQRYQEVGTPAELGARQAQRRMQEAAIYAASLPGGRGYFGSQFEGARKAALEGVNLAQGEYSKALGRIDEVPEPTISETPMWAKRTIPEAMPKESNAASTEQPAAESPAPTPTPKEFLQNSYPFKTQKGYKMFQ